MMIMSAAWCKAASRCLHSGTFCSQEQGVDGVLVALNDNKSSIESFQYLIIEQL